MSWLFENAKTEDSYLSNAGFSNTNNNNNMNTSTSGLENNSNNSSSNVEVVTVDLSCHQQESPLGMRLAPALISSSSAGGVPENSTVVIIAAWERLPVSQRLGPIQRSGKVRLGDRLVRINDLDITHMTFRNVMDLLKDLLSLPTHSNNNNNKKEKANNQEMTKDDKDTTHTNPTNVEEENDTNNKTNNNNVKLKSLGFVPLTLNSQQNPKKDASNGTTSAERMGYFSGENSILLRDENSHFRFSSKVQSWRIVQNHDNIRRSRNTHLDTEQQQHHLVGSGGGDDRHRVQIINSSSSPSSPPFVEYEIECQLISRCNKNSLSRLTNRNSSRVWKVWKRYSEFKALDKQIRESHGWQINSIHDGWGLKFPPPYNLTSVLFRSKCNPTFIETRRNELKKYWESLHLVQDLFNFVDPYSHRYSSNVAKFLNMEQNIQRHRNTPPPNTTTAPFYNHAASIQHQDDSTSCSSSHQPSIFHYNNNTHREKHHHHHSTYDDVSTSSTLGHSSSMVHDSQSLTMTDNRFHNTTGNIIFTSPSSHRRKKKRIPGASKSAYERSLER